MLQGESAVAALQHVVACRRASWITPATCRNTEVSRDPQSLRQRGNGGRDVELSVVMPCLNEAETVATCVRKALGFFAEHGVDGEVIIADNGSTDGSPATRRGAGARVVPVPRKGYGSALIGRHPRRARHATSSWATPTTPTTSPGSMPFVERAARRRRPGHGQPVQGRHRARRHAVAAPLPRQPGPQLRRPAVLPQQDRRLPLRAARLPPRGDPAARPADRRHGVRQRDGGQARTLAELRDPRGADDAVAGRPHAARRTCAPGATAGGTCASCCCTARAGCS